MGKWLGNRRRYLGLLAIVTVLLIAISVKAPIQLGGDKPDSAAAPGLEPAPAAGTRLSGAETPVPPAQAVPHVQILIYHEIGDGPNGLFVSVKDFSTQMKYLRESGYCGVTLSEGKALLEGVGAATDGKPVVLTFDDGYASFMSQAYPVLTEYGFKATVFVIVDRIDRPNYLTWEQIEEIAAAGMEVGSHSKTHPSLPTLGKAALEDEIIGSKMVLEQRLGRPVPSFCYPAGEYDQRVIDAVQGAGYRQAVTVKYGWATPKNAPLEIPRIRISRYLTQDKFAEMFAPVQPYAQNKTASGQQ